MWCSTTAGLVKSCTATESLLPMGASPPPARQYQQLLQHHHSWTRRISALPLQPLWFLKTANNPIPIRTAMFKAWTLGFNSEEPSPRVDSHRSSGRWKRWSSARNLRLNWKKWKNGWEMMGMFSATPRFFNVPYLLQKIIHLHTFRWTTAVPFLGGPEHNAWMIQPFKPIGWTHKCYSVTRPSKKSVKSSFFATTNHFKKYAIFETGKRFTQKPSATLSKHIHKICP